jgi:hypothetical protein
MFTKAFLIQIFIFVIGIGSGFAVRPYIFPATVITPVAVVSEPSAVEQLARVELQEKQIHHEMAKIQRRTQLTPTHHNRAWKLGE